MLRPAHATRFLRLAALRLPASRAVEVGAWSVGMVAIGAAGVELRPGGLYRARIALHGLAKLASKSRLIVEFSKLGFVEVQAIVLGNPSVSGHAITFAQHDQVAALDAADVE